MAQFKSSELQKIPNLCFVQKLIETYNISVVIYVSQLLVSPENVYQVTFSIQIIISGLEVRNFFNFPNEIIFAAQQRLLIGLIDVTERMI